MPFPSYEVFNLFAEYQLAHKVNTKLRLDVRNIFNEEYADRATYQGFATVTPLYQPGRSFLLSISAMF